MSKSDKKQPDAPVEMELKLGLSSTEMEALLTSSLLRERTQDAVRSLTMRSIYYDTSEHQLRARSASLRVREVDGRYIQTLKSAHRTDTAYLQRGEWEVELGGPTPQLEAFDDSHVLKIIESLSPDDLKPVFETRVRRRSLVVDWPDDQEEPAKIEVAFDDGKLLADGREASLSELELELIQGKPGTLFSLAEALRAFAPFRIEPLDKAARGWLLATGKPPAVVRAKPVALEPDQRVEETLSAILSGTLWHWLDNEPGAVDGRDPHGLHQLRVALRRLRSAFTLFAEVLAEEPRQRWNGEMRWLLGELGPARDLDVLIDGLLPPVFEARDNDPALLAFRDLAEARRAEARQRVREALGSQRYADLAFHFAAWVAREGWTEEADADVRARQQDGIAEFAANVLDRRYRKAKKLGKQFERLSVDERHQVRIALKKLRYGIEFFADLFPGKRFERFRKATTRMQERLGHLNDVAVASRIADALVGPLDPAAKAEPASGSGQLVGWYSHQVSALEPETVAAWQAFKELEPFWNKTR